MSRWPGTREQADAYTFRWDDFNDDGWLAGAVVGADGTELARIAEVFPDDGGVLLTLTLPDGSKHGEESREQAAAFLRGVMHCRGAETVSDETWFGIGPDDESAHIMRPGDRHTALCGVRLDVRFTGKQQEAARFTKCGYCPAYYKGPVPDWFTAPKGESK